jgi:hypothetical protein
MKVTIVTLRALDGDREENMVGAIQGSLTEEERNKIADKVLLQNSGEDLEVAFAEVTAYEDVGRFRTLVQDNKTDLIIMSDDEDEDDDDDDYDDDEDLDEDEDEDLDEDEFDDDFDDEDEDDDDDEE